MATHPVIRVKATTKIVAERHPQLGKGRVYKGTPGYIVEFNPPGGTGNDSGAEQCRIQFAAAAFDNGVAVPRTLGCTEEQFEVTGVEDVDD